ncbi:hypothetical protein R3P38DRAFT_3226886 [Favolaschia claudopus]|uniref:Uncharacterized protein n=1 Tax=Favolaschia claudopus TaxID=2862362 RepID=A0AAV9ZUT1_9AGAR
MPYIVRPPLSFDVLARQDTIKRVLWCDLAERYLHEMNAYQLFTTALRSRMGAMNVAKFMAITVDEVLDEKLPELEAKVAAHSLNTNRQHDHQSFVALFRRLIQSAARDLKPEDVRLRSDLLEYMTAHLLSQFELRYGDVKLMQAATGALISGSFIAALVHRHFRPNDLDFFCGNDRTDDIVKYFQNQVDVEYVVETGGDEGYQNVRGVRRVTTLTSPRGCVLNIVEAYSESPQEIILNFHSAPTRGALGWDAFAHYEVHRARNGLALVTPRSLPVNADDLDSQIEAWNILHKYMRRGVTFIFEYNVPHECGKHIDCPATPRTTADDGCLRFSLPPISIPDFAPSPAQVFTWSLGPVGMCSTGTVGGVKLEHTRTFQHLVFRKLVGALIQLHDVPDEPVQIYPWTESWSADGVDDSDSDHAPPGRNVRSLLLCLPTPQFSAGLVRKIVTRRDVIALERSAYWSGKWKCVWRSNRSTRDIPPIRNTRLLGPRNEMRPVLATDVAREHFFLTRDKGMLDVEGYMHRYSYKWEGRDLGATLGAAFRVRLAKYRTSIIARVLECEYEFLLNPLGMEGCPRESSRLTLGCPPGVDLTTGEFYDRQIQTLNEVVAADAQDKPGVVDRNWTKQGKDGAMLIEVCPAFVGPSRGLKLVVFEVVVGVPPDRLCAELPVGRDVEITLNLSKDEYLHADGILHKKFVLWLRDYRQLHDSELGRS